MEQLIGEFRLRVYLNRGLRVLRLDLKKPQRRGLPIPGPFGIELINLFLNRRPRFEVDSIPEANILSFAFGWFGIDFIWKSKHKKNVR